jgi:hypothetical protein
MPGENGEYVGQKSEYVDGGHRLSWRPPGQSLESSMRERVVNPTVGSDADMQGATGDLMINGQVTADGTSKAGESLPPGAMDNQVVVGDIPMEPSCFQSRPGLLAELDRVSAQVSVIHAATGLNGLGATQLAAAYARAKLAAGWRMVAWVNGAGTGSLLAGLAAVAEATGMADGDSGRDVADAGVAESSRPGCP